MYIGNLEHVDNPKLSMDPETFFVHPSGKVHYCKLISFDFGCKMDFQMFPFDSQSCLISIESWSYTIEQMAIKLDVEIRGGELNLNQFDYDLQSISDTVAVYGTGRKYPQAQVVLNLKRKMRYYLFRIYLPSGIFSSIAWFALFIPIEYVPGKFKC